MIQYVCLVSVDYVPLSAPDTDTEVVPDNIGALQLGLQALAKQRAEDFARSEQLWQQSVNLLAQESEAEIGAGAEGTIQVSDDFHMAHLGGLNEPGFNHGWYW